MEVSIDIEEIQQYLPHRYPFLLVDRVEQLDLGKYIKAYKNITLNNVAVYDSNCYKSYARGFNSRSYGTSFRNFGL